MSGSWWSGSWRRKLKLSTVQAMLHMGLSLSWRMELSLSWKMDHILHASVSTAVCEGLPFSLRPGEGPSGQGLVHSKSVFFPPHLQGQLLPQAHSHRGLAWAHGN